MSNAKKRVSFSIYFITSILILFVSCGRFALLSADLNSENQSNNSTIERSNLWVWVNGSSTINQNGVYGTSGISDIKNIPSGRHRSTSKTDKSGNFWLFGGWEYNSSGNANCLNDLWKFDGTNWTWISGNNIVNQKGIYGTLGIADDANVPGARAQSVSWTDNNGNFWLFGGRGYDINGDLGYLNDLWKFDGTNWTWISGSNIKATSGVTYDTHAPGACADSISWTDNAGNLWLFGGYGYDCFGNNGTLNDLWKYDGANWNLIRGNHAASPWANYGEKNIAKSSNIPSGRILSIGWVDRSGNLWLFGGSGYDTTKTYTFLNDLWKFDGTNWTWISGNDSANLCGVYGELGIPNNANVPGGRNGSISWIDLSGNFWLFGGIGGDITGSTDNLNDLWKFDGTNWTWVSGSNVIRQVGNYGVKNIPADSNIPGARSGSISWMDFSGKLWLFGGFGYDGAGNGGYLNDLWKFKP